MLWKGEETETGKMLFPRNMIAMLTDSTRLKIGPRIISCSCREPGKDVSGLFELHGDGMALICKAFHTSRFACRHIWEAKTEEESMAYNPKRGCFTQEDQRRYANLGSKLFVELRRKIETGRISSILGINADMDRVTYCIDPAGRYHVSWKYATTSKLLAVVSTFIV